MEHMQLQAQQCAAGVPTSHKPDTPLSSADNTVLTRRRVYAGAGTAGALAAAAAVLPLTKAAAPAVAALPSDKAETGGYQLTEHVLRYYQTARV